MDCQDIPAIGKHVARYNLSQVEMLATKLTSRYTHVETNSINIILGELYILRNHKQPS